MKEPQLPPKTKQWLLETIYVSHFTSTTISKDEFIASMFDNVDNHADLLKNIIAEVDGAERIISHPVKLQDIKDELAPYILGDNEEII